jgi:hypothetical protein
VVVRTASPMESLLASVLVSLVERERWERSPETLSAASSSPAWGVRGEGWKGGGVRMEGGR